MVLLTDKEIIQQFVNPSAEEDTDMEDDEDQDEPTTKYFEWSSCRYVRAVFEMVQGHCIVTVAAQKDQRFSS